MQHPTPVYSSLLGVYTGFSAAWRGCHPDHFAVGRNNTSIVLCTVHVMAGSFLGTRAWFASSAVERGKQQGKPIGPKSSAHFGASQTGLVDQYVRYADTAFHSGGINQPTHPMALGPNPRNPNLYSVGIECEDRLRGREYVFPMVQTHAVAWVIASTALRCGWAGGVTPERIAFHREFDGVNRPHCPPEGAVSKKELVLLGNRYLDLLRTRPGTLRG